MPGKLLKFTWKTWNLPEISLQLVAIQPVIPKLLIRLFH